MKDYLVHEQGEYAPGTDRSQGYVKRTTSKFKMDDHHIRSFQKPLAYGLMRGMSKEARKGP